MKKINFLVSLFLMATNIFATDQNHDWIQMTQYIQYTADTNELSRTEYTYDTEGRETGFKYYIEGELTYQYRDYQYEGRTVTCWNDSYSNGSVHSSFKLQWTYKGPTGTSSAIDLAYNSILIYPNPIKEVLLIKNADLKIENVEIYNMNGQKVLSTTNTSINVSQLLPGNYYVKIKTDKTELTKKIIKE